MISLYIPALDDYYYEAKVNSDPKTMSYNAGYNLKDEHYHYLTGCIDFPKKCWEEKYRLRINEKRYFAYVYDDELKDYVGYVYYQYDKEKKAYYCGVVIEDKYRHQGYGKKALKELIKVAKENHVLELYDDFEIGREDALRLFKSCGFKVVGYSIARRFNKCQKIALLKLSLNV